LTFIRKSISSVSRKIKNQKDMDTKKITINGQEIRIMTLDGFMPDTPPIPQNFKWEAYAMLGLLNQFCAEEAAARILEVSFLYGKWVAVNMSDLYDLATQDLKFNRGCFRERNITIQKNIQTFWDNLKNGEKKNFTRLPLTPKHKTLIPTLGLSCFTNGLEYLLKGYNEDIDTIHHSLHDEIEDDEIQDYLDDCHSYSRTPLINAIKGDDGIYYHPKENLIKISKLH